MAVATVGEAVPVNKAAHDPQIDRLLALARKHLGTEAAFLTTVSGDHQVITAASGTVAALGVAVGETGPLPGLKPAVEADARHHPAREGNIGSFATAPWYDQAGHVAGMLCCLSRHADPTLDDGTLRYLALLTDLIADHLGSPAGQARRATQQAESAVRRILATAAISLVVQPVVRLTDGVTVAYEALSRFDPAVFATPDLAFAAAADCGLGLDLEMLALEQALEHRDAVPAEAWLGLNLSAATVASPRARTLLLRHAHRRLGVEITEHTPIDDYEELNDHLRPLRAAGINVVVDDAGAGFASLSHILQLRPDTIKLDISLVRAVHEDPVRRALARSLVGFAHEIGAALIAEGVETDAERAALDLLGVVYGQGYLWGRPRSV
jgi:EAL domain-containing protein (putative c-di-GMP-specific phosphodiesterase class I)